MANESSKNESPVRRKLFLSQGIFTDDQVHVPSFKTGGHIVVTSEDWTQQPATIRFGLTHVKTLQTLENRQRVVDMGTWSLVLQPGLTIVTGTTGKGKTTFVTEVQKRFTAMSGECYLIKIDEPVEGSTTDHRLLQTTMLNNSDFYSTNNVAQPSSPGQSAETLVTDIDEALALATAAGAFTNNSMMIIDSLRGVLFETSGPAGSKGIVMPFFSKLTRISNALAAAGVSVIATVNPMDDDVDFVRAFNMKLSASVAAYIEVTGIAEDDLSIRISERPDRTPVNRVVQLTTSRSAKAAVNAPLNPESVPLINIDNQYERVPTHVRPFTA